jgi:hypothetical protein
MWLGGTKSEATRRTIALSSTLIEIRIGVDE